MGSKKRSTWSKQKAEFAAGLGGFEDNNPLDDLFAREDEHREQLADERDAARRWSACEKKARYATRAEAEAAIAACEEHGTRGLTLYRCNYCGGWHLTSHGHASH